MRRTAQPLRRVRVRVSYDIVIVGSGFGGSILARVLASQGLEVALLEKGRHPRFALGESSTPLAALSLERLADRYALPDLRDFATHGRWLAGHPRQRRGLKRGFTFYRHDREHREPTERLLVAASPNDRVADAHWLRADFDELMVERAIGTGVDYFDETSVQEILITEQGVEVVIDRGGRARRLGASLLIDASGPGGSIERSLGLPPGPALATSSHLLFGHFEGVTPQGAAHPEDPYPAEWAAVHHLIDEGWIYELRFDDGLVSAGALLRNPASAQPERAWKELLAGYPALADAFRAARSVGGIGYRQAVQHRRSTAAGHRWASLPHTYCFVDPLFSTGIAWTLLGVERLAELILSGDSLATGEFGPYRRLLAREAEQIDALIAGAYDAMPDLATFSTYSLAYFTAVSWAETGQRLLAPERPAWEGFLGIDDPELATLPAEARRRLPGRDPLRPAGTPCEYAEWLQGRIASRDIAGFDRYAPSGRIPVDLELLVARAGLFDLTADEVRARLPLLRGDREL